MTATAIRTAQMDSLRRNAPGRADRHTAVLAAAGLTGDEPITFGEPIASAEIVTSTFSLTTHNGEVTISNPVTGQHRTFRVRTILRGDLAGRRVIELLVGTDNTADYQGFGFVGPVDGSVSVWRKFRGQDGQRTDFERFAAMLERPADFEGRGLVYQISGRCRTCNRLLTDPQSIALGQGPTCRGR